MNSLKVCFVGLGSIAKRHIKNLRDIASDNNYKLRIDVFRHGADAGLPAELVGISEVFSDFDSLYDDYDVIFITNPTVFHYDTLVKFKDKTKHFFIEKPVFTFEQLNYMLPDLTGKICYVACPMRYTPVIGYLKKNINVDEVYSVRAISSSYLPDWRPNSDYTKSYSAQKSLGGGVSVDLIHEWDYLQYLFGFPQKLKVLKGKFSDLLIDTEDSALYLAEYPNMTAELHLDYFGRAPVRDLMLICKNDTLKCNLIDQTVKFLKSGKLISFKSERDIYQKAELEFFINIINGKVPNTNTIDLAKRVLLLTNGEL